MNIEPEDRTEYWIQKIAKTLSQKGGSWEALGSKVTTTNVLEWDGDKTGKEFADVNGMDTFIYKVADCNAVSANDLIGAKLTLSGAETMHYDITEENLTPNENYFMVMCDGVPTVIVAEKEFVLGEKTISSGIWYAYMDYGEEIYYVSKLEATAPIFVTETITPIPEKYLPDNVGGGLSVHFQMEEDEDSGMCYLNTVEVDGVVQDCRDTSDTASALVEAETMKRILENVKKNNVVFSMTKYGTETEYVNRYNILDMNGSVNIYLYGTFGEFTVCEK